MASTRSALNRAKALANQIDGTPIDLAEALWNAEKAKPGSLRAITGAGTNLKYRRARYLLSVWDRFVGLGFPRDRLARIGWTKLSVIARHCPPGKEATWLDYAQSEGTTAKGLEEKLKGGNWGKSKPHSILLRLSPAQYRTFATVLVKYGAKPPKKGKGLVGKERALTKALSQLEG